MNNLYEQLMQNNLSIEESIRAYAEKDGFIEYITQINDNFHLSVNTITNLILSITQGESNDYSDLDLTAFLNPTILQTTSEINLDIFLVCIKYFKKSYIDFLNSQDLDDASRNHFFHVISSFFDYLEINFSKIWIKYFRDNYSHKNEVENNIRYQIVVENSLNPIIIINFDKTILDMNTSARKLFFELTEEYFFQGSVDDTLPWLTTQFDDFLRSNSSSNSFEQSFHTKKGAKYFDIKMIKTNSSDIRRNEIAIVMNNITGYKKMTKEISENKHRYQSLFKNMFDACCYNKLIVDENNQPMDFTIMDVNDTLIKSLGIKRDDIIGKRGLQMFSFLNVSDFNWLSHFGKAALNGANIRIKELFLESINKWYSISIYSSEDGYFAFVFSDISEKKQADEKVNQLAYFDVLTGLPNGKQLDEKIKASITDSLVHDKKFAVMFIDITNFKKINNTLGHKTGDAMLTQIANRLKGIINNGDTVARLGGDKFVIVNTDVHDKVAITLFANQITNILKPPFTFNDHEFFIEANIGISVYPSDADNMHTLKRNADTAMFMAKNNPSKRYLFHTNDMNDTALKNLIMEADLRKALQKDQLSLHYQPLVNIETGNIIAFEALLRWEHPITGMISPNEFIPIAEENGLIIPIGEWVLKAAAKQCKEWQINGYNDFYMSVNVSIHQLQQNDFVDRVKQILKDTELDPKYLRLEITESVYMQHIDAIINTLTELKSLGLTLSLDDFGTGYSSLNYLNKLPINTLKIDKSFIRNMDSNRDYSILTKAIIKMAHSLNLDVVAEGVETEEELNLLREHKCDKIQGFLFSKPIPSTSVDNILMIKRNLYSESIK